MSVPVVYVRVAVRVQDAPRLIAYAKERYKASWGDSEWEPEDLAEAVFEALIASNENPSPDLIGIEIGDHEAVVRDE